MTTGRKSFLSICKHNSSVALEAGRLNCACRYYTSSLRRLQAQFKALEAGRPDVAQTSILVAYAAVYWQRMLPYAAVC
jgi:hypothetical protein